MTDHPSHRAAPPIPKKPPAEVIAEAVKIARDHDSNGLYCISDREARRILHVYWPQYIADLVRRGAERHWLTVWQLGFRGCLYREQAARDQHRTRRKKWEERQRQIDEQRFRRHDPAYIGAVRAKAYAADRARQEQADKARALRAKYNTPEKIAARLARTKADDQG